MNICRGADERPAWLVHRFCPTAGTTWWIWWMQVLNRFFDSKGCGLGPPELSSFHQDFTPTHWRLGRPAKDADLKTGWIPGTKRPPAGAAPQRIDIHPVEFVHFTTNMVGIHLDLSEELGVLYVHIESNNTLANFRYRIGTPGCPIKWLFYQGSPPISAALYAFFWCAPIFSENYGCQFYSSFWMSKFSDHGLQFYRRLQFYRDMSVLFQLPIL